MRPRSVAVVGANDDSGTFGGRIWHYLSKYSDVETAAVNMRPDALKGAPVAGSLSELGTKPDLVVLATPASTILGLVSESISIGAKAALVFSQVPEQVRPELRQLIDEAGFTLLGPGSLGLINATDRVVLSSSVSLERPPRPGPMALVAQSGALMGVLHASATEQGLGLGLCIATGSQLQVRVEHVLAELAANSNYTAIGAHLEDLDIALFADVAESFARSGRKLIVLKGGLSDIGNVAAAGHSGALAGNGRAFQTLAHDLGVVVASHPAELLEFMHAATIVGKNWRFATVSGGLSAIIGDLASSAGLGFAESNSELGVFPPGNGRLEHANPIDLDALPMTTDQNVAAIRALTTDTVGDGVILVLNDKPDLEGLLSKLARDAQAPNSRLHLCSECSCQYDYAWRAWVAEGGSFSKGLATFVHALASTRERSKASDVDLSADGQLMSELSTYALMTAAGIPALPLVEISTIDALEHAISELGLPCVLKLAGREHRGAAGVITVEDLQSAQTQFRRLTQLGPVVAQPLAQPGLEFYVGITLDQVFGPLFIIGAGGPAVEEQQDVSMAIGLPERDAIWRCIGETRIGRWLLSSLGSDLVNLEELVDVAVKAAELAREKGGSLVALDLNPVVVGPLGAVVVDAKVHMRTTTVSDGEEAAWVS
jgi:acyl-CoA synthetase (NDP forming)